MLGIPPRFLHCLPPLAAGIFPVLIACLALSAFTWNRDAVFFGGETYFTDGDCYARMTRVRRLQESPLAPIRHHDFENFPLGTTPHTTAPLDYLIAGLAAVLGRLPLAGAWISPFLGLATIAVLWCWGRGLPFALATIFLLAVSPMISHGFLLGRPDHQSLLLLLVSIALAAEARRGAAMVSATAWALALWVSLFEPLVLFVAVLGCRAACGRLQMAWKPVGVFLGILLIAFLWDGFRVAGFDSHFSNWAKNIGELRHATPAVVLSWAGWLVAPAVFILGFRFFRTRDPHCLLFGWLLTLLIGLSFWHVRWGYFLVLVFAMSLPWILPVFRWRLAGWGIFALSLWPVAAAWEQTLFPTDEAFRARAEGVVDAVALRDASIRLRNLPRRGVIAPWWLSPEVVWWSGQSCVAGSSHQSLPGIVDTAEFYLSDGDGREILEKRKVGYLVAYEPERVISNAAQILGRQPPSDPMGRRLYEHPQSAGYPLIYSNRFFRVFEIPASPK